MPGRARIFFDDGREKKGDFLSLALSLQDVFSDSGNAHGSIQKTSCPSDTGQGKEAQLKEITRHK